LETSVEIKSPSEAPVEAAPPEVVVTPEPPPYDICRELLRATHGWLQLGTLGFAILCIIVGAVEALFGR
jgi:hypothetical protein